MQPQILPDSRIVRTYTTGDTLPFSESDSERENENLFYKETLEDEERIDVATRLQQNKEFLEGEMTSWTLVNQNSKTPLGDDILLIPKPTASRLSHRLLNPYIYKTIQDVGGLNGLVTLLNVPDNWEDTYNDLISDGLLIESLNDLSAMDNTEPESYVQGSFNSLVISICTLLGMAIRPRFGTKIIIGGILAKYEYDLRSMTDAHFQTFNGINFIASKVPRNRSFPLDTVWYHDSRGIQVLSALYKFNCPTFLLSQKQFKLFVENKERNAILTFPYGEDSSVTPHVNSTLVKSMGTSFLKASFVSYQ